MAFQHCWQPCCQTLLKCQVKLQLQIQHVLVVSNHLVKQGIGEGCPLSSLDGWLVWYACQPAIKGCLEGVNTDTSESPQFLGDQVKQPGPFTWPASQYWKIFGQLGAELPAGLSYHCPIRGVCSLVHGPGRVSRQRLSGTTPFVSLGSTYQDLTASPSSPMHPFQPPRM